MSKAIITESYLTGIANAIRAKLGVQDTYTPPQMAAAIESIPTGGITPTGTKNITQNGTHDVTEYANANVNVQPNLQSKTATENGTVTPDQGYDGLSQVVVNVSGGSVSADFDISDNLIPLMTGPTAPSGEASASSALGSAFAAYLAFNRSEAAQSMQGGWLAGGGDNAPWLMYQWETLQKLNVLEIHTANNSYSYTLSLYIEGLTSGDVWENILGSGSTVNVTFAQNTYGSGVGKTVIALNGGQYKAIRIRGTESFYKGVNQSACTFSSVYAYSFAGQLPGVGYYGFGLPSPSFGSDGNLFTEIVTGKTYQKVSGTWTPIVF